MKSIFLVILLFFALFSSCKEKPNRPESETKETSISGKSGFDGPYQNISEHPDFKDYKKITDTSFYVGGFNAEFGIMEIQKGENKIVIFKDNFFDENYNKTGFTILDTIQIRNLSDDEILSIGYCFEDGDDTTNIIAIIKKTEELHPQDIKKAWKANSVSGEIEEIDPKGLSCWNEHFNGFQSSKI